MKKPHEETWVADVNAYTPTVQIENPSMLVAEVWRRHVTTDEVGVRTTRASCVDAARFIAAAPDMARALLGVLKEGLRPKSDVTERHTADCWDCIAAYHVRSGCGHHVCESIHAALKKAGVI